MNQNIKSRVLKHLEAPVVMIVDFGERRLGGIDKFVFYNDTDPWCQRIKDRL